MRTLRQYWRELFASVKLASRATASASQAQGSSDRDMAAISSANHTLAANLKRSHEEIAGASRKDQQQQAVLEQRIGVVEAERDTAREQALRLETSLDVVSTRLQATEVQIRDLQTEALQQATEFETSLQATAEQVEKLAVEHHQYEGSLRETQAALHRQDSRLASATWVAAFALLLAVAAGAVLIWDVQKNAAVLDTLSGDLKHLMSAVEQKPDIPPQPEVQPLPPQQQQQSRVETAAMAVATTSVPVNENAGESSAVPVDDSGLAGDGNAHESTVNPAVNQQTFPRNKRAFFIEGTSSEEVISLSGGVQYQVVQPGRGRSPVPGDRVVVDYLGITRDGRVFDDTYSLGQPAELYISELDPAWQETLLNMEEGAQWEVSVPPGLVLINSGSGDGMPESEAATYLIELLEIVE